MLPHAHQLKIFIIPQNKNSILLQLITRMKFIKPSAITIRVFCLFYVINWLTDEYCYTKL
ncbi:hypothetical protein EKA14_26265 [Bacillus mycoides]|nr:hypothetical protein EKA14_26265 [Bacillus mycoides]